MRCMLGACHLPQARAYSFAVYYSPENASRGPLCQFKRQTESSGVAFFEALALTPSPLVIVIKMAREIEGSHIARGYERSLQKLIGTGKGKEGSLAAVKRISGALTAIGKVKRGMELEIKVLPRCEGVVFSSPGNIETITITDPAVAKAVLSMYLGDAAVSREGRREIRRAIFRDICTSGLCEGEK
jgi:hypothetical protein